MALILHQNYQRNLHIRYVYPQHVRYMIKKDSLVCPRTDPLVSYSICTVNHYQFTLPPFASAVCIDIDIKISYMLLNCTDGFDPAKLLK